MRLPAVLKRRPSAAMVISVVALFISLGGASYAAVTIPNNSVGPAQLRSNAVTYTKIQAGAVGTVRANLNQLQARVYTTCATGTAVGTISNNGKVSCNAALPAEFGSTTNSVALSGTAASVAATTLPAGATYVAFANPSVAVTGTGIAQRITASCTLTVGANTQTQSATINTGTVAGPSHVSIPLQLAGAAGASSVSCTATAATGTLPATTATGAINALQTAANN